MAEVITDRHMVLALRPFVRATRPLLDSLREADPLGLRERVQGMPNGDGERTVRDRALDFLAGVKVPGTAAWSALDVEQRTDWWVSRVGRFTALLAAVPGLLGALADRLPVQDAVGAAGQGMLLCAIAGEHGVADDGQLVRLLAAVLFGRTIDPELAAGHGDGESGQEEDRRTAELTEEIDESERKHGKVTLKAAARTVWRLGRTLWSIQDELGKRPQGRFYHRAVGMLPVVGMVGDYLGERSALKRVARRGTKWLVSESVGK